MRSTCASDLLTFSTVWMTASLQAKVPAVLWLTAGFAAIDSDLGVPVAEVHAQAVRMAMPRLDAASRDTDVEHANERVLEGNPVGVGRDTDRVERVVFRLLTGHDSRGNSGECDRREKRGSTHGLGRPFGAARS